MRARRLLLTSAGGRNAAIRDAFVGLLGRPIEECTALCIPSAMYGHPHAGPGEHVVGWTPPAGGDRGLGLVDFPIFPHLDHVDLPYNTLDHAEAWAADLDGRVRDR